MLLGNTGIAVLVMLTGEFATEREISKASGVSFKAVQNNLRRLKIHGLAVRGQDDRGRFIWKAGIAPEEYVLDPDPGLLANRKRTIERDRCDHMRRYLAKKGVSYEHDSSYSAGHDTRAMV